MRRAWVVLCIVLAGSLFLGLAGCSGNEGATTTASTATTVAPTTTAAPSATSSTAAETVTTTTANSAVETGNWQKVFEFSGSGSGDHTSELFELSGAPARISYTVTADTIWTMAAFVEPEGWDIKAQGGFPVIWESGDKTEGFETLEEKAGSYFLYVTAANCDWTLVIEEQQ